MIPDRDYYADKDGKLTTDASRAAIQIAVTGCFLDPRVANRYGITDSLVSVDEPNAPRRVVKMEIETEEKPEETEELEEPQEPAVAAKTEEPKAKKPAAKKGEKKK